MVHAPEMVENHWSRMNISNCNLVKDLTLHFNPGLGDRRQKSILIFLFLLIFYLLVISIARAAPKTGASSVIQESPG